MTHRKRGGENKGLPGVLGISVLSSLPLPLFVLQPVLAHLMKSLFERHPHLFDRLGDHQNARFLIDPTDLPFTLLLRPDDTAPELSAHDRKTPPPFDAAISGPIGKFVDLVNGVEDGDALFFSRDLEIKGDTEAVIALRNTIDDMEIDLVEEIESLLGPLAGPTNFAHRQANEAGEFMAGLKTVLSETLLHRTINRSKPPESPS